MYRYLAMQRLEYEYTRVYIYIYINKDTVTLVNRKMFTKSAPGEGRDNLPKVRTNVRVFLTKCSEQSHLMFLISAPKGIVIVEYQKVMRTYN